MIKNKARTIYPSLICDTKEIQDLRKKIQKPFSQEEFLPFYIFRPLSIYLAYFIVNRTKISANQITIFMALLSFISPLIIYFIDSTSTFFITSFILYMSIYFLDVVDGEVARLREKTSKIGEIFDAMLWFYLPLLYIVYVLKLETVFTFHNILIFLLLSIFTVMMSNLLDQLYAKKKFSDKSEKSYTFKNISLFTLRFSLSQSAIFMFAPIVYYAGIDSMFLESYIYLCLTLYFINSISRVKNTLENHTA